MVASWDSFTLYVVLQTACMCEDKWRACNVTIIILPIKWYSQRTPQDKDHGIFVLYLDISLSWFLISQTVETRLLFQFFAITKRNTPQGRRFYQCYLLQRAYIVRISLTLTGLCRGSRTTGDKWAHRSWRSRDLPSLTLSSRREPRAGAVDSLLGSLLLSAPSYKEQCSQDPCPRGMRSGRNGFVDFFFLSSSVTSSKEWRDRASILTHL